jgi:uncharacterized membrane protein
MNVPKKNIALFISIILFTILAVVLTEFITNKHELPNDLKKSSNYIYAKAVVKKIYYDDTKVKDKGEEENYLRKQEMDIKILNGSHKGELYKIRNTIETIDVYHIIVSEGDKVLVNMTENEKEELTSIHIYERVRENYTYLLVIIFVLSLAIIGGAKGIKSVLTLIFTGIMVIKVLLPLILHGYNPIITAIVICTMVVVVTFLIISGWNKKTLAASLGTLGGVLIAGLIALIVGGAAKVTGLSGEHAQTLAFLHKNINLDFKGILFAGILIGALGAVMDVCMSIASSVSELYEVNIKISKKQLIKSGMNIGKDIMGTMSNTLILAYTGGALQLLLLLMATNITYVQIINLDMITSEIITALAGSIGLVWSVPITVLISAAVIRGEKRQ